ncbi:GumC family protein [Devosia sp.]|uniref:GumC family protein n=1 Tax=Devosia sp. TaxID=1871048 RepID=UPI001A0E4805|nr:polysaccharide biosynthesis tyrosine autokinase [Devosia sp.]MBE0579761.1 AAA family ATPase [Devosia sp.]
MEDQEFSLGSVIGTLRRQIWVIVVTVVVVVGISSVVILSLKPMYQATTLVLVDPTDKDLLNPGSSSSSSSSENARVESEVSIAKAESTLQMVLREARLVDDPDFAPTIGLREQIMQLLRLAPPEEFTAEDRQKSALSKLRNAIAIERQGLTYLITISANASSPDKAAQLANTMAEMYIRAQLESKVSSVLAGRDIMQDRVAETRTALVQSEQAFNDFIIDSAASIAEASGRTDLEAMRLELQEAVKSRERMSAQLDLVETGLAQNNWLQVANALGTQSLRDIRNRLDEIDEQLANMVDGSENADALRAELLQANEDFRIQATAEMEQLRQDVANDRAREADLQLQLRSNILTSNLPPEVLATMYELQQSADISRTQYQQMLARLRDIEAQAYLQLADSRIVSSATPPSFPDFPNTRFLLAVSGLFALLLGIGLAFFREHFIGGIVSPDQLESISRSTVVTTVPHQKRLGKDADGKSVDSPTDLIIAQPYSAFAEAIRRIMVTIDQALRRIRGGDLDTTASVILVTSANAGEGKTTIAISLARAFAQSGKSTILIDADLRRPNVHHELGMAPSDALQNYLRRTKDTDDLSSITITDTGTNASVIIGGNPSGTPSGQVVSGERFSRLLNIAARNHDVVIIDTPPVGALVDALYLAQYVDLIVNVVRYATTSQQEVRAALRELNEAKQDGAEIICVLNAEQQSKSSNKRRFGGYYIQ